MPRFQYEGTKTFDLPKLFWADHCERGCRCHEHCPDVELHEDTDYETYHGKEFAKFIRVELTALDASELYNDASYYSTEYRYMGGDERDSILFYNRLGRSAKATMRRVEQVVS